MPEENVPVAYLKTKDAPELPPERVILTNLQSTKKGITDVLPRKDTAEPAADQ